MPVDQQLQLISATTFDIDQLSEMVNPWNLHLSKLDKGSNFRGHFDMVFSEDVIIGKTDFSGVLHQTGAPPAGMRTFHIPVNDNQHLLWRKLTIDGDCVGLFPKGGELDAVTKPGFKLYVVSLMENDLLLEANKLGLDSRLLWNKKGHELLILNEQQVYEVRSILSKFFEPHLMLLDQSKLFKYIQSYKKTLITFLVKKFLNEIDLKQDLSNKTRIMNRFKEFVIENKNSSYSSDDICNYVGASERSIQYVVKQYTQLTPNQFLKSLKLTKIREALKRSDSEQIKINELAANYGFWHMSQFAVDYKYHFGELPSDTLHSKRLSK